MGATDKAKDKLEQAEGKVKNTVGAATGDRSMEAEGKAKEVSGNLKQAGEKVKDALGAD
ncbi:MAG TPA: CsbD family protein [Acidimicrobiales bacterium]|nr:CsbD family protein [Acidimicrobiales bacterium]